MQNTSLLRYTLTSVFILIALATIVLVEAKSTRRRRKDDKRPLPVPVIESLHALSEINSRFATTLILSKILNPSGIPQEVVFNVILPNAAFISNFTMLVDGKLIVGEVKEKEAAKKQFDQAKARGQTAGLVAQKPRETNRFSISVNVAANDKASFNLTYQEVLKRVHAYKHVINIAPGQVVDDMFLKVKISERLPITTLVVPDIDKDIGQKTNKELLTMKSSKQLNIQRDSGVDINSVTISSQISPQKQRDLGGVDSTGLNAQMVVLYDVQRSSDAGEVVVADGYFVHFFAPEDLEVAPKHVIFVLDDSGSMEGEKDTQMKKAMEVILGQLNKDDLFNIVRFDDDVSTWSKRSTQVNPATIKGAIQFVNDLRADGSTNIYSALDTAFKQFRTDTDTGGRAKLLLFLTDGQATAGQYQDSSSILKEVKKWNNVEEVTVHAISFGNDADYDLIRSLSIQNDGIARKVYEGSDASLQLEGFYDEVSSPLLRNLKVKFANSSLHPEDIVQDREGTYYSGSEIVSVGKITPTSADSLDYILKAEIVGQDRSGRKQFHIRHPIPCYDYCTVYNIQPRRASVVPAYCHRCPPRPPVPTLPDPVSEVSDPASIGGYIERMWAYLTIKKLLEAAKFGESNTQLQEKNKAKALELSIKYNFVTELTSMVVTKPNEDSKRTAISDISDDKSDEDEIDDLSGYGLSSFGRGQASLQKGFGGGAGGGSTSFRRGFGGLPGMPGPPMPRGPNPSYPRTVLPKYETESTTNMPDTTTTMIKASFSTSDPTQLSGKVRKTQKVASREECAVLCANNNDECDFAIFQPSKNNLCSLNLLSRSESPLTSDRCSALNKFMAFISDVALFCIQILT